MVQMKFDFRKRSLLDEKIRRRHLRSGRHQPLSSLPSYFKPQSVSVIELINSEHGKRVNLGSVRVRTRKSGSTEGRIYLSLPASSEFPKGFIRHRRKYLIKLVSWKNYFAMGHFEVRTVTTKQIMFVTCR